MDDNLKKNSWLARLKEGLKKSSHRLTEGLTTIFVHKKLDEAMLSELEDLLISTDLGVKTAQRLVQELRQKKFDQNISEQEVREFLSQELTKILMPYSKSLKPILEDKPKVIIFVGINGSGKTTTIGKLAHLFYHDNFKVRLVAGDTFRAAAVEQLKVWGDRLHIPVEIGASGADSASLIYTSYKNSQQLQDDILLIDTAGRLHNKEDLMAELRKICKVIQKINSAAPHECLLVLDATIGQNAHLQVEMFQKTAPLTGLILTKLDGTAKGGVLVSLVDTFKLPVYAIGVGENSDDLQNFDAQLFARSLMGLTTIVKK